MKKSNLLISCRAIYAQLSSGILLHLKCLLFVALFLFGNLSLSSQNEFDEFKEQSQYDGLNQSNVLFEKLKPKIDRIYANGSMTFLPNIQVTEKELFKSINLNSDITFKQVRERKSRFDENASFKKFDQFYKGIKVQNKGYTIKIKDNSKVELFTPNIVDEINIDITPKKSLESIQSRFEQDRIVKPELIISNDFGSEYKLIWSFYKANDKKTEQIWIDAHTGQILKTLDDLVPNLTATVPHYGGPHQLNDWDDGNFTRMVTPTGDIIIYEGLTNPAFPLDLTEWTNNLIPMTTNTSDWGTDASDLSKAAFYGANLVVPEFLNMGVDFGTVNIATGGTNSSAFLNGINEAHIRIGMWAGEEFSTLDIIGHELGHEYIGLFLDYTNINTNQSLHEGIADIMGTYVESFIQGVDWVICDDNATLAADLDRDLSSLACLTALGGAVQHERGLVIGHWFFALSTGIPADDIPAIGMQTAMDIIVEALNNLGNVNAGFPEMRTETLLATLNNFGVCSDEYQAVVNAWDRVCVTGASETCPCDLFDVPVLSTTDVENPCPEKSVALDQFSIGTPPANAVVMWSKDGDPSNGVSPVFDDIVTTSGEYFAYYYLPDEDCFGPASEPIRVNISSCCQFTNTIVINSTVTYDSPMSFGGSITINAGGTLIVESKVELGQYKEVRVNSGGTLILQGGDAQLTKCPTASLWQGLSVFDGGEVVVDGGRIDYALHGIRAYGGSTLDFNTLTFLGTRRWNQWYLFKRPSQFNTVQKCKYF